MEVLHYPELPWIWKLADDEISDFWGACNPLEIIGAWLTSSNITVECEEDVATLSDKL